MIFISKICFIYAKFPTVDFAEIASRNIKNYFPSTKEIKIKYKNTPEPEFKNEDNSFVSGWANSTLPLIGAMPAFDSAFTTANLFQHYGMKNVSDWDSQEPTLSTESTVIIKALDCDEKKITSHLRALGGTDITTKYEKI